MYIIKTYSRDGTVYNGWPYEDKEDAENVFNELLLFGRFVKAELWSGSLERNEWQDDKLLQTKP